MALAEDAAAARSGRWIGARDLAILLLLYGAGLAGRRGAVADGAGAADRRRRSG